MGYLYNMDVIINETQLRFLIEVKKHTKEAIRDTAKKYDDVVDFREENPTLYRSAVRFGPCYDKNGIEVKCFITKKNKTSLLKNPEVFTRTKNFLQSIIADMKTSRWNEKKIRDIAEKYSDYSFFQKNEPLAYKAARNFGPCYDKNGNKVSCFSPNKFKNSLKFFNDITSHMTRSEYGPKLVYSYTFFDDKNEVVGVYVGITNDEERRKGEHLTGESTFTDKEVKSAVSKFKKENPLFRVEYKSLTEYIPFVDAQVKEEEYVNNAKSNGYNILNIAKTGGGGSNFGFPDKYLIDKVNDWIKNKKDKKEEPLLSSFVKDDNSTYRNINNRISSGDEKIYDKTLGKLIRKSKSDDMIIKDVQKWINKKIKKGEELSLSAFEADNLSLLKTIRYRKSKGNQKLYDETIGKLSKLRNKLTDKQLIDDAMSCNSFSEFLTKYRTTSYQQSLIRGLLPQIQQMFADGLNTPDQTTPETTPSV
jgi:hypothetical protein